jgi:hypothetical protein
MSLRATTSSRAADQRFDLRSTVTRPGYYSRGVVLRSVAARCASTVVRYLPRVMQMAASGSTSVGVNGVAIDRCAPDLRKNRAVRTAVFLAMMFRNPDGSLTFGLWSAVVLSTLMIAGGVWSLAAPSSFRTFYFNVLRSIRRLRLARRATSKKLSDAEPSPFGWGWSSPGLIRISGAVAVLLAIALMTWVIFFTVPGRAY